MADKSAQVSSSDASTTPGTGQKEQRKIPGNLPYLTASGTLKKALEGLITAQRPDKFNADFLENILKLTGGAARATIPIMKKVGMLASDGTPTDLYARFRTDSARGSAALQALRAGFPEIFKRSEYAHTLEDSKLKDIIVEITGLKQNDPVANAIRSTFNVFRQYVPADISSSMNTGDAVAVEEAYPSQSQSSAPAKLSDDASGLRLSYNINIVLPETSDLNVLNAIFKSIKENLMR